MQILLAAARKEKVEDRVAVVEAAGLKAMILDVESFATQTAYEQIAHLLPRSGAGQTVAIIDVGAQNMHINILRLIIGKVNFHKKIPLKTILKVLHP